MELAFVIWAVGTLPQIAQGLVAIGMMGTFAALLATFIGFIEDIKIAKVLGIIGLLICIPLWIVGAVIPSKETAYAMAAGYGVQTIAENPKVQDMAKDGTDVVSAYLKKLKTDLEKSSN